MKSYPVEFRQKILDCYFNEPISQRQLAKRFCVSLSFIEKLIKQHRETKDISPKTYRCGGRPKLKAEELLIFTELVADKKGATLAQLAQLFQEKTGIKLSVSTVSRLLKRVQH
jgi:transposase